MRLTTRVHDRDAAGLTYVYPVVSRRSRGVSVGVNLNTNNACNWRCVYCQVPGLVLGKAPEIDLGLLERELDLMLDALTNGDYMERHVPPSSRRINDVAFSGNGEPTSSPQFAQAVALVERTLARFGLAGRVKIVLITNGSLIHRLEVQAGLRRMAAARGVVWYKLDSATETGQESMNTNKAGSEHGWRNLRTACEHCPTWLQTMMLARHGEPPSDAEQSAYLELIERTVREEIGLCGVLLYGLARRSYQPEAAELSPLPREWMEDFARRIGERGVEVRLSL